jgi:hypothetical protein
MLINQPTLGLPEILPKSASHSVYQSKCPHPPPHSLKGIHNQQVNTCHSPFVDQIHPKRYLPSLLRAKLVKEKGTPQLILYSTALRVDETETGCKHDNVAGID